jgi:hypothetical protein
LLIVQILKKLAELCKHIVMSALSVQYIVCRLGDARKSMSSTFKRLRRSVWKKDGDSRPDSTYPYSEMHGALDQVQQEKLDKAMKAPIRKNLDAELREKGLI